MKNIPLKNPVRNLLERVKVPDIKNPGVTPDPEKNPSEEEPKIKVPPYEVPDKKNDNKQLWMQRQA